MILALYAAGLSLPEVDPDRHEHEDRMVDSEARHTLFRSVVERLGDDAFYQMVFEPFDQGWTRRTSTRVAVPLPAEIQPPSEGDKEGSVGSRR